MAGTSGCGLYRIIENDETHLLLRTLQRSIGNTKLYCTIVYTTLLYVYLFDKRKDCRSPYDISSNIIIGAPSFSAGQYPTYVYNIVEDYILYYIRWDTL